MKKAYSMCYVTRIRAYLTLILLMSCIYIYLYTYTYGSHCEAINFNVVYIWTYVWQR
jgi:hypothetical protein